MGEEKKEIKANSGKKKFLIIVTNFNEISIASTYIGSDYFLWYLLSFWIFWKQSQLINNH